MGSVALHLLCHGLRPERDHTGTDPLAECAQLRSQGDRVVELAFDPAWSIEVGLGNSPEAEISLRRFDGGFMLVRDDIHWPVTVAPRPKFLAGATPSGIPRAHLGRTFSSFLLLHPLEVSADGSGPRLMFTPPGETKARPLDTADVMDLVEAGIRQANREEQIDCVVLRWMNRISANEVEAAISPLLHLVHRNFDVVVAAECPPPTSGAALDILYARGVDAVSIPCHTLNRESPRNGPQDAPLRETLEMLTRAVEVFPRGTVLSTLLIGLDSDLDTMRAVTSLARMGVHAGFDLRLLRDRGQELRRAWGREQLRALWLHLEEELAHARLLRPWTPHPRAEALRVPPEAFQGRMGSELGRHDFWRSRPGQTIVRNLIRLRRRLRVRQVEQSFESSGL
jgi:hypothetical protein